MFVISADSENNTALFVTVAIQMALLPVYFAQSLIVFIYVGKAMHGRDTDFHLFFRCMRPYGTKNKHAHDPGLHSNSARATLKPSEMLAMISAMNLSSSSSSSEDERDNNGSYRSSQGDSHSDSDDYGEDDGDDSVVSLSINSFLSYLQQDSDSSSALHMAADVFDTLITDTSSSASSHSADKCTPHIDTLALSSVTTAATDENVDDDSLASDVSIFLTFVDHDSDSSALLKTSDSSDAVKASFTVPASDLSHHHPHVTTLIHAAASAYITDDTSDYNGDNSIGYDLDDFVDILNDYSDYDGDKH